MSVCHIFILLGISGDLSYKLLLPSLWTLHDRDMLPSHTTIVGYARSNLTIPQLQERSRPFASIGNTSQAEHKWQQFWHDKVLYVKGQYTNADMHKLNARLDAMSTQYSECNRLFYFALPPHLYPSVAKVIKQNALSKKGWNRIVLEKPFGSDLDTWKKLDADMSALFDERDVFRLDHYLGEEMIQNILPFRFANQAFEPIWNRQHIEAVEILFKEPFGAYGRGAYFDKYGMIRDVVQNHLLQALILVAMDQPKSLSSEDISAAKVKLLKQVKTLEMKNVVLAQYTGNASRPENDEGRRGYLDDPTVKANSTTSTYCLTILEINNTRWANVPFVINAGKALDEDRVEIRLFFRVRPNLYSHNDNSDDPANVLTLRLRPREAIYLQKRIKSPGSESEPIETRLSLNYADSFKGVHIPTPHEQLILNVFHNHKHNFVHATELDEAWRIFTPALKQIDEEKKPPPRYVFAASYIQEASKLLKKLGLVHLLQTPAFL